MNRAGNIALLAAAAVFAIFVANIIVGAYGGAAFLSDLGEMLTLFAASILFVIAIVIREAQALALSKNTTGGNQHDQEDDRHARLG